MAIFVFVLVLKIVLGAIFSSDYENLLFTPFIKIFIQVAHNPWQYVFQNGLIEEFPYPPLMLYLYSFFLYLPTRLGIDIQLINSLIFKIPTLIADLTIYFLLTKLFENKRKEIAMFYWASPIILYASYMHSQLDLVPTSLLFIGIYLLIKRKLVWSAILFGLAVSSKFHVIAILPLVLIYVYRNYGRHQAIRYFLIPTLVYLFITYPYLLSQGYINLVLSNPKQTLLFDSFFVVGNLKVYLPLVLASVLYARFFYYRKINTDLFFSYVGLLFASFVFLVSPSPAWYVWLFPYISIFFIKIFPKAVEQGFLYLGLTASYIVYFVFFRVDNLSNLIFMGNKLFTVIPNKNMANISFSLLEFMLMATIYSFYKFGVRSNSVYKKNQSFVVGISGDSGVGKTTILEDMKGVLRERMLGIEGDADHKWGRTNKNWQTYTHLDPRANFLHRQAEHLSQLKKGKSISRVEYDHKMGNFTNPREVASREFIVMAGLHTLYLSKMRKMIDLKVYIDTDERIRKRWKIARDTVKRGEQKSRVMKLIKKRIPDYLKHVKTQREFADIIIRYFGGGTKKQDNLSLELVADANLHLDEIVGFLREKKYRIFWDYEKDLRNQRLILNDGIPGSLVKQMTALFITNSEEIVSANATYQSGYRGFVQFFILYALSERMREDHEENEF